MYLPTGVLQYYQHYLYTSTRDSTRRPTEMKMSSTCNCDKRLSTNKYENTIKTCSKHHNSDNFTESSMKWSSPEPWLFLPLIFLILTLTTQAPIPTKNNNGLQWWKTSIIYQVYPRSFQDSNGDGIGDLKGIENRIEHFKDLGIGAVWLSPIYDSPMADFGYDVKDYTRIWPQFGTMLDFDSLVSSLHSNGIKIIMDFIPNHTSRHHKWFEMSRNALHENDPYWDYYVWRDCGKHGEIKPTNWVSEFSGSSWEFDPVRKQCYLHQFLKEQPDLNLRNPQVMEELHNILRFWMKKGVDGFRSDAMPYLYEDVEFRNETLISGWDESDVYIENCKTETDHKCWNHTHTMHLPEVYDAVASFRKVIDDFSVQDGIRRLFMTEGYGPVKDLMHYYGNETHPGADFPFNFLLLGLNRSCNGICIQKTVDKWMSHLPVGRWANWVAGNHDQSRIATKLGDHYVNAISMLLLTLPGTPTIYNGDEIGMTDIDRQLIKNPQDPFWNGLRDPERTPMQWDDSEFGGFVNMTARTMYFPNAEPWLPINPNRKELNIQEQQKDVHSNLNLFKQLSKLRQEPSFQIGDIRYVKADDSGDIFSFIRKTEGDIPYLVIINFGKKKSVVKIKDKGIQQFGRVVCTTNQDMENYTTHKNINIKSGEVVLNVGQGLILSL